MSRWAAAIGRRRSSSWWPPPPRKWRGLKFNNDPNLPTNMQVKYLSLAASAPPHKGYNSFSIGGKLLLPLCLLLLCYSTPAINTQGLLPCHEEHVAVVIICESNSLRYQTPTCDCLNVNQWSSQIGSNGRIRKDQVECNRQQRRRRRSNKLSSNYSCSETKTNHRNNKTCSFYKYGRPSSLVGRS